MMEKAPKVLKEGTLFKQRNHFKGWRNRWFVLDDQFLHYYLERDNVASRTSIQIESGTIVVTETNVKISNDVAYYPFLISHPKSSMVYRLSTTSKEDRDLWVAALNGIINMNNSLHGSVDPGKSSYIYSPSGSGESTSEHSSPPLLTKAAVNFTANDSTETEAEADERHKSSNEEGQEQEEEQEEHAVVNPEDTLTHIPAHCRDQVESTARKLMEAASSDDPSRWTLMFNKKGVAGYSEVSSSSTCSSSSAICVKGVCRMPFTVAEIYNIVGDGERRVDLDSQLAKYSRLHWCSRHTGVEHLQFKPIWPTTARDFCNLTHWRLLKSGTMLNMGLSEKFPDLCPEQKGFVRASLIGGGYVLKPVPGGTLVSIIVQSDLKGTLPGSICNLAAQSQPYVLLTLRTLLEKTVTRSVPLPLDSLPPPVTYEELLACAKSHQKGSVESEIESTDDSTSSPAKSRLTQRDFVLSTQAGEGIGAKETEADGSGASDESDPLAPLHPDVMRSQIPSNCSEKVESLVQQLLRDASDTKTSEWAPLSNSKDIKAYSKVQGPSGAAFYIKAETFFPFTVPEIFAAYFDPANRPVIDSQLSSYTRLRWLSRHVGYEYMQFKRSWPTTARDACNLTHWRLLNNGTLVDLGFSDKMQPEDNSFVRAELQLGGYVFTPCAGGTRAVVVVHTLLGGSLPNSVCHMASAHQPSQLHKMRGLLEKMFPVAAASRPGLKEPASPGEVYKKLLATASRLQGDVMFSHKKEQAGEQSGAAISTAPTSGAAVSASVGAGSPSLASKPLPDAAVPAERSAKRADVLGLTLLLLPVLDLLCHLHYRRSVIFQPLAQFSILLAAYVCVVYYEKLIAWLLRKHLGVMCKGSSLRAGAEVYRFDVDMSRLEECLEQHLGGGVASTPGLTAAHIAVKAVGECLGEMRHMHGVLQRGRLFREPGAAVDVSVTESSGAGDHAGLFLHKVHNVSSSATSIAAIAKEVGSHKACSARLRTMINLLSRFLRPVVPVCVTEALLVLGNGALVALLLAMGVGVCPFGAARVVSVLPKETREGNGAGESAGERNAQEVDFSVLPMSSGAATGHCLCLPPVTLTLSDGGVKFLPVQQLQQTPSKRKVVRKFRVMSVSVCLHEELTSSPGCTLQERQEFIAKLKALLSDPNTLF